MAPQKKYRVIGTLQNLICLVLEEGLNEGF